VRRQIYKKQDSLFVTKRAVAVNFVQNDSVYIHGKRVTGKEKTTGSSRIQ
jgi:hypothetical protein